MNKKIPEVIKYLRTPQAIRERCKPIFNLAFDTPPAEARRILRSTTLVAETGFLQPQ
ncbi:MAG: URC4/urg3 family protein [Okeania sp. SIO2C9]|uniref:hypothetical protein n=1 Tax=Okeania sp. SIO2C9 TaxID=2607791 RepID=UPI0013BEE9A3|nr:hypothetical protein [Okeania sp. SIO2C9]NEQ74045.1 URC4/urg3 family protein [Okeania sp. SIO2C9]